MSPRDALIARAKSFELDTPYVPPPGDPLEHHASGFAKVMCSAVFITGLNRAAKAVHVTIPNGATLTAKYLGSQGCVTLPAIPTRC